MTGTIRKWLRGFARAPVFSPTWLFGRAMLVASFYAACHAAGFREHTTFLSGNSASPEISMNLSSLLGVTYLFAYFGFVLVVPIFLIAATLLSAAQRLFRAPNEPGSLNITEAKGSSGRR